MRQGLLILAAGVAMLALVTGQQGSEQGPKGQSVVKARNTIPGHGGQVFVMAFSPDGRTLASTGHDCLMKLWAVTTGKEVAAFREHNLLFYRRVRRDPGEFRGLLLLSGLARRGVAGLAHQRRGEHGEQGGGEPARADGGARSWSFRVLSHEKLPPGETGADPPRPARAHGDRSRCA
jgi:WD40 repeat protein